jgi:hypothetical protein
MKKYIVKLAKEERASLSKLIAQGEASARKSARRRSSACGSAWWKRAWVPRSIGIDLTRHVCGNWMESRKRI